MKFKVFQEKGSSSQSVDAPDSIFKVTENKKLLSQIIKSQLANRRNPIAHTKDRGDVSGGGKKPFRQKGTGNARAGSTRSPLWTGGGVTFGPKNTRNFSQRVPRRMARLALKMALSERAKAERLIIVSKLELPKIKTSQVQAFLEKLPIEEGKILIVVSKTNLNLELATANLPYVKTLTVAGLNLIDVLQSDYLITDKDGLGAIEKQLEKKS